MTVESKNLVDLYIDSLTEHAGNRRLHDLRNESSKGKQRTSGEAKGEALSAFDKEDFRQHVRQTLNDPNTRYVLDESNGRIVFYNGLEANNVRFTFNPMQFTDGDGHAGTLMRDSYNRGNDKFEEEISDIKANMKRAPEVRSVSDGGWVEHLEKYRVQLENVPSRQLGKGDLRTDYARAGDAVKTEPLKPLDYSAPNSPKVDSPLKKAYNVVSEAAGPVAKKLGYAALGAVPILGYLGNSAEANELKAELRNAIDQGEIAPESMLAFSVIMEGHKFQGGLDPTIFGEAGIQAAFHDWADDFNISDEWREKLEPSSIGKMMIEGTIYIGENGHKLPSATIDVATFAGEQTASGVSYLVEGATDTIDQIYDDLSGNTLIMQDVYDRLPVLDLAANDDLYDHTSAESNPIYNYPVAHDLALIKSQIVASENAIEGLSNGTKKPLDGMNKNENIELLEDRLERLNDRFEGNFEQAQVDGNISEIEAYVNDIALATDTQKAPVSESAQVFDQPAANDGVTPVSTGYLAFR